MVELHPEYVVDKDKHPKAVLLPFDEWQKLTEELEELDDIRAYDKAKSSSQERIPFQQAVQEIEEGYDG